MQSKKLLFILLLLAPVTQAFGQAGWFLGLSANGQQTNIFNGDDMRNSSFYTYPGYKVAPTISLTYNFDNRFGLRTGLAYAPIEQKYRGSIRDSTGLISTRFESSLQLDYLKVPLMFQFNSKFGPDEVVNLTIGAGLLLNFLQDASLENDYSQEFPPPVKVKSLFKSYGVSFVTNAQFNFFLTEKTAIFAGAHLERGVGDIEDKDVALPKDLPLELYFPVSVPKEATPNISTRLSSKVVTVGLFIGLSYRIAQVAEK